MDANMDRKLRRTVYWAVVAVIVLLVAAVVVALALNVITFFSSNTNLLANAAGIVAAPFRAVAASVTDWVEE